MRITNVRLTPVAVPDVPLLNLKGVHQSVFLRTIIELETDEGLVGLGESYGAARTLTGLRAVAGQLVGLDPFHLNDLAARIVSALPAGGGINAPTALTDHRLIDVVFSAYEVACLDLQGKLLDRPVCDLLGGAVRDRVHFGGYLFYKFAKPADQVGDDMFGEVLSPETLVAEAQAMHAEHGFKSFKLKGGVLPPEEELESLRQLRAAFPEAPLRIDPMGAWTVPTARRMAYEMRDLLEYLEDPAPGMDGMAELATDCPVPLATNLVVVQTDQLMEAHARNAVQIVLSDHHYWRGMTGAMELGRTCAAAGMGVSMHSNSHLGISLAAMIHVAAATPALTYDCDTHYSWSRDEVIKGGKIRFENGSLRVPEGAGLGVELDPDALARLHELYLNAQVKDRDDTAEIRKYLPDFVRTVPKW